MIFYYAHFLYAVKSFQNAKIIQSDTVKFKTTIIKARQSIDPFLSMYI